MKRYISDKEKNYAKEKNNNLNSYLRAPKTVTEQISKL